MINYAHSLPDQDPPEWQTLDRHLGKVADIAEAFANNFASGAWARAAGWLHDLGKADSRFQGYLRTANGMDDSGYDQGRINHSSAGAAYAVEKFGPVGRILAYLVAGHHAGLPDWHAAETGNAALSVRMAEAADNLGRLRSFADSAIAPHLPDGLRPPDFARRPEHVHLWMRMLFSCLADADFLDTEAFMDTSRAAARGAFAPLDQLKPRLDRHLRKLEESAPKTTVNVIRQEILTACRVAAMSPPGLFSLTVPTGGGKTLSGTAFAFDHAVRYGKSRIVYVIPYTSIIEQTANILRDIFGEDQVIEHHSNLDPEQETPRARLAAENWDAPVIVTTNVQFFESLYAARASRCRKLHSLVNSVIILDEAQLLPPHLLSPCVEAMNQLVRNFGATLVLSTATQPTPPGLDLPREIIANPADLYARLRRTEIRFDPAENTAPVTWASLAASLRKHEQVLCIVNTRRDSYDLWRLMPEGTIHLSASMCGEHRSAVIAAIKQRLAAGHPCRVVSTQLVEAGVDIDFPVVYRALAGLDSVAQAAGRCNREGRLAEIGGCGQVHVFRPPKSAPPGLLRKGEDTTREMIGLPDFNPDSPAEYQRYFRLFYGRVNDNGRAGFHDLLVKDVQGPTPVDCFMVQFRSAAAKFRMIDDEGRRPVFVRYGDGPKWIEQLRRIGPTRENLRRLQRFTVNVPLPVAARMQADGLLEDIRDGMLAQTMPNLYSEATGLDIFRDCLPVEDMIV